MKRLQSFFTLGMINTLLFVLSIHATHAQTENDTIVASQYFKKADTFLTDRKLDSAAVYFNKALPIYQKAKAWERVARCYNKVSRSQLLNAKYEESINIAKKALRISITYLPKNNREEAYSYYNIAEYYWHKKSDYETALKYCQKSINTLKNSQLIYYSDIVKLYNKIGFLLVQNGEYIKARNYSQEALKIGLNTFGEHHVSVGKTYSYLAIINHKMEDYYKAIRFYNKDISILRKTFGENHINLAITYNNIAMTYRHLNQYDSAISFCQKSIYIRKRLGKDNHPDIANTYNTLGILHKVNGEYEKALQYYNRGLDIRKKINEKDSWLPIFYGNIGVVYKHKKKYDEALLFYKKALDLSLDIWGENHRRIARIYNNMAFIFKEQGEYEKALLYSSKSLKIYIEKLKNGHSDVANCYNYIGNIYLAKKRYSKAIFNYKKAKSILIKYYGENHSSIAESINHIADVYTTQKDLKNSIEYYDKAIVANIIPNTVINPKVFNPEQYLNPNILLTSLSGKAKNYIDLYLQCQDINDLNEARHIYQKVDILIQHIRQTFTTYQDKVAFAKKTKEIYHGAIQAQLVLYTIQKEQQVLDKAFYYAEKSKANTLKELLTDANAKNFTGLPTDLVILEKELRIDGAFYQSQIIKERSGQKVDATKITRYENKLFDIGRRKDSLTAILEKNYPKYYQLKYENRIVSVADIQKNINAHTTVLEFFTSDSSTYAFTISKDKIAVQELSTPDLSHNVEKLRTAITNKDLAIYKKLGYDLYNQLLAPIAEQLVGDQLIIIPDGPLWHCNFEVLLTQKDASNNPVALSYVLRGYAISYANSANLLFGSHKKQNPIQKQECLAFSFSDSTQIAETRAMSLATLRGAGDDLPGTRKEIKAISNIIDGQYYYGSQAIEANFKKNAGQYNILHLALHGDVDNEHPENSKLYFTKSKDTIEDNLLYSHELFALNIPAELTVLSACNTGAGKIATGEGIMSLGTAFQYAGTKSLLLTSWEVSDQTTPELMQYFYTNLKAGMHKAKALQQAKLQYLSTANINRTQPFYWAGFYLVGDTAPIPFENNALLYWILGVSIVLLLTGLFWYKKKRE